MWEKSTPEILKTLVIFEKWAKTKTNPKEWQIILDLNCQDELAQFAHYQSFVIKAFKILLPLKETDRKRILEKEGSVRLAQRWLIWSNTCLKNEFLP